MLSPCVWGGDALDENLRFGQLRMVLAAYFIDFNLFLMMYFDIFSVL